MENCFNSHASQERLVDTHSVVGARCECRSSTVMRFPGEQLPRIWRVHDLRKKNCAENNEKSLYNENND